MVAATVNSLISEPPFVKLKRQHGDIIKLRLIPHKHFYVLLNDSQQLFTGVINCCVQYLFQPCFPQKRFLRIGSLGHTICIEIKRISGILGKPAF